jgi:O-acetyl-ADP-ribose deacetylase (regulator of RNase III)
MSGTMTVVQGDITEQEVDAIVNAANQSLLGGGGVDGAIHRAAGPDLLKECRGIGGCPTGEARITKGYRLKARHVIHCVGPRWRDGKHGEPELLASCYRQAMALAAEHRIRSIGFPGISTGIYGFPLEPATRIAIETVARALAGEGQSIEEVRFVTFGEEATRVARRVLEEVRAEGGGPE